MKPLHLRAGGATRVGAAIRRRGAPTVEHLNMLLLQAGYDPDKIPEKLRLPALHMAWAFDSGLFDIDDVAQACDLSYDEACDARDAMRFAARPGTIVG